MKNSRQVDSGRTPQDTPASERLFIGVYPTGISYADRSQEEHGDYKSVAFLPYDTLELEVRDPDSPLLAEVRADAAKLKARKGELFAVSTTGQADVAAGLATGQTVRLGGRGGHGQEPPPGEHMVCDRCSGLGYIEIRRRGSRQRTSCGQCAGNGCVRRGVHGAGPFRGCRFVHFCTEHGRKDWGN